MRATRALGAAVVLLACGAAPLAHAADDGLSLAPAGSGRPSLYAEGAPGAVLEDTVSVTNRSAEPRTVTLRGAGPGGMEKWFAFARRKVTVPPRTRADVPFTVAVPEGAAPGDRSGAVVARGGGKDARVPLRLRVDGPALAALTVERVRLDADAGRITYELVNRGNTVLAPRVAVRADGVLGELLDRAPHRAAARVAPGSRVALSEPWSGVPSFDVVDVRLTVTAAGGVRAEGSASARLVPWPAVAAAGAGAVAAGVAGWFAVRHVVRRGRRDPRPPEAETAAAEAAAQREPAATGTGGKP
ncbi:hypothetical protein [Streptomyces spectabilis]|uniref:COG1470 family protein n=1 Tax=Streptomyces spectabilis TaxID=68270 RepID=UPI001863A364|nr:hypothetical protein [Streptomyces spectabilis]